MASLTSQLQWLLYVNRYYGQKHRIKIRKNLGTGSLMGTVMSWLYWSQCWQCS